MRSKRSFPVSLQVFHYKEIFRMLTSKKLSTRLLPSLMALLGLLLVACGGGTVPGQSGSGNKAGPAPASQQILRFYGFDAPVTDIATFDPGQASDRKSV